MNSSEKNESAQSCEFQENLNILRQIDFFSGLPLETLKVFAYLCTREVFKAGEAIFTQDEDDGQSFYIISGSTKLYREGEDEGIVLRSFQSGDFLGGLALLGSFPRLFTMKAAIDTTCLIMRRDKFAKAVEQFPELIPRIFNTIVTGIRGWEKRLLAKDSPLCKDCRQHLGVSLL